jgi:hypothetical protein
MKGKSLRWIVILGLVVVSQLAVVSSAFALFSPTSVGNYGGVRPFQTFGANYPFNLAAYTATSRGSAYILAGNAQVSRAPNYPGISQTVLEQLTVERYIGNNTWVRTYPNGTLMPVYLTALTIQPYDTRWYTFPGVPFTLPSGNSYRIRAGYVWQTANTTRLGWRSIFCNENDYARSSQFLWWYIGISHDTTLEGWVYFPVN